MLLIAFCGKFCSFYKLFMPKLLSQSKHEEFESNSVLKIRDQKERRAENAKELELQEKFCSLQKFRRLHCSCKIFPAELFTILPLFILDFMLLVFYFLLSFWFSSYFLLVIMLIFLVFGNLYYGLAIKAP